ncbi:MAG: metallophosphoesterase [Clostridia bacterium]|nr:metallophosphoesterase [Clostridia bacterium]
MTKQEFFDQNRLPLPNARENDIYYIYKLEETGQVICEVNIKTNKSDGNVIDVAVLADTHVNSINEKDETDEEVMYTFQCRGMTFRYPSIYAAQKRAAEAAKYADLTVIAGDVVDYASNGALEYAKEEFFDKLKPIMCALGSHDMTKNVLTKKADALSYEERENVLKPYWPNALHFDVKTLGNKVNIVILDNGSRSRYTEDLVEKLEKEIEKARKENNIILIFQHEPVSSEDPKDRECKSILLNWKESWNLFDGKDLIGAPHDTNDANKKMLDLIKSNADVVRGLFCGHYHDVLYTELKGSYIDKNGQRVEKIIPQYNVSSCPYCDCAGVVTMLKID